MPTDPAWGDVESAEELFEQAPCGYLSSRPDGTILRANRTLEEWLATEPGGLVGRRFQDLLSGGGRIYHETHYAPLLRMQGWVREIALDVVRGDGRRLPVLVNSALERDDDGEPRVIRTILFDASDRRRYEQELLRVSRREHEVALELQRSLLAGTPPSDPAFALEVAYQPAEATLEVGGDWYDAFWIEPGRRLALVVGDVVGRGIGAATTMGQLRSATRALAGTGLAPGAVLEALDAYAVRHGVGDMATIVHVQLDVHSGELRYVCAGHPPPILLGPGGEAQYLWDGRSVPLAAHLVLRPRSEATVQLEEGATLVLYTDGLFERHDEPLQSGLDRLRRQMEANGAADPAELAPALMRTMLADRERFDDVCLLALQRAYSGVT